MLQKVLLAVLIGVCYFGLVRGEVDILQTFDTTKQCVDTTIDLVSNIVDLVKATNAIKTFAKISEKLTFLGPAAMVFSTILSFIQMFLPASESPEMVAIREGFEKVNQKLDEVLDKIDKFENIIEFASAKTTYAKSLSAINHNYQKLMDAQKMKSEQYVRYFMIEFERTYDLAATQWYDGLMKSTGEMGIDVVLTYRERVQCNPNLLGQFCSVAMQFLVKGLAIEGAYMGYKNLTQPAIHQSEEWKRKMSAVRDKCTEQMNYCNNNWERYAYKQVQVTYNAAMDKMSNQEFTDRVIRDLKIVAPQRNWLAVSYNDAYGSGEHTYYTTYPRHEIWNQNKHDFTVFSNDPSYFSVTDAAFNNVINEVNRDKNRIENSKEACATYNSWYRDRLAGILNNSIRAISKFGVVYVIQKRFDARFSISGGHVHSLDMRCVGKDVKVIIFQ